MLMLLLRPLVTRFGLRGSRGGWLSLPVVVTVAVGGNIASARSQPTGPGMQPNVR